MKVEQLQIQSNEDDLMLSVVLYIADNPKGIVQILHGMSETKERYAPYMEFLCNAGYIVIAHDHRGHGDSVHALNDHGYFYKAIDGKYLVSDVHRITCYIKNRFEGLPLTLLGHSMGSLIARNYVKEYDYEVDKLILSGSPSAVKGISAIIGFLKIQRFFGMSKKPNKLVDKLAFGPFHKKFGDDFAWLCSDPKIVEEYKNSNDCGFVFTTNGFLNLFHILRNTYDEDGWLFRNPNLPILFLAGIDDPCIASVDGFMNAVQTMKNVGYTDVTYKLYEGMRHEILNEIGKEEVYNDSLRFIEKI